MFSEGENICVTTACKLLRIDSSTLSMLSTTYVACSSAGGCTPFFDKISCLTISPLGIFLCTVNSTLLQLWSHEECQLLFDIAFDHRKRKPSLSEEEVGFFVTSLTYFDRMLWTGTSDGYIIIYSIDENSSTNIPKLNLKRYPSGCRLSPQGSCGTIHRNRTCYIPTDAEAKGEEVTSLAEGVGRPSRVSISIDCGKQQFKVSRKIDDSAEKCERTEQSEQYDRVWNATTTNSADKKNFSSDCEHRFIKENISENPKEKPNVPFRSPIPSASNASIEYHDPFEEYSDEANCIGKLFFAEHDRGYAFNAKTTTPSASKSGSDSNCSCANSIHRKDLEFNDPILLIVPESPRSCENNSLSTCEEGEATLSEDCQQVNSRFGLSLVMKLKIADKPVKKMVTTRVGEEDLLLTCAGSFSESESLLIWRKEPLSGLWINDPVPPVDVGTLKQ
ncbi:hypothetical protein DICVIV_11778 [Dictyocaulus viviparus]|uniref:Uncharacterized protein n=1 Tax=Dictyocaulus viviparus TaxID=29172 RepID=A0A0D8XIT6_DICVI|nr:hypothetical protein DICVIV_11778 [Dictyocaulus viviparus]